MSDDEFKEQDRMAFAVVQGLLLEDRANWVGIRISREKVGCTVSFTHPDLPERQITRTGYTFYGAFVSARDALRDELAKQKPQ